MLNTTAVALDHLLVNQTAVIITPASKQVPEPQHSSPHPRAGTVGRISKIMNNRVWLEIALPFNDIYGVAWHFQKDPPAGATDRVRLHHSRTLEVSMALTAVAILSASTLSRPLPSATFNRPEVLAIDAVRTLARHRLQEATVALNEAHDLVAMGADLDRQDDAELQASFNKLVAHRIIRRMRNRIRNFFDDHPWYWQLKTSVQAYGEDFHVRVESSPEAPNVYQADALEVLGVELAGMLEPGCDPLSGRFNRTWENPGFGRPMNAINPTSGAQTH